MEEVTTNEDDRICIICKRKLELDRRNVRPLFALTYYILKLLGGKDVRTTDIIKKLGYKTHNTSVNNVLYRLQVIGIVKKRKSLENYAHPKFKKGSPITYWTILQNRPAYIKRAEEWLAKNDIKLNL